MSKYINYGDVNPIEHGGIFVLQESETSFRIVKNEFDGSKKHYLFDLHIDISDTWIDKESVLSYIGMTELDFDPVQYAIGCTEYYSYLEFGGNAEVYATKKELIAAYAEYGIII